LKPTQARSLSIARVAMPMDQKILSSKLNGLQHSIGHGARRATVVTTGVNSVNKALLRRHCVNSKPRCTGLDMDIAWEAQVPHIAAQPLQGIAKVKLDPATDRVAVTDIQVVAVGAAASAVAASASIVPPDVEFAVRSMDSVIMEQLNDFMWAVENGELPMASFEEDDSGLSDSTEEQEAWPGQWEAQASTTMPQRWADGSEPAEVQSFEDGERD